MDSHNDKQTGTLYDIFTSLKIDDMSLSYDDDGTLVAEDAFNTWKGKEVYYLLIDDLLVYEEDGSVLGISDELYAEFKTLAMENGIPEEDLSFGATPPALAPDNAVNHDVKILSLAKCEDATYGASVVQFAIGSNYVSFAFSKVDFKQAVANPASLLEELSGNKIPAQAPHWSALSESMLSLILESEFDMRFVEYDSEGWSNEKADAIWAESCDKGLSSVVRAGEDGCHVTVYAGAIGSVNWKNHPVLGIPCLEHVPAKPSLDQQIKSAAARRTDHSSAEHTHLKEPSRDL